MNPDKITERLNEAQEFIEMAEENHRFGEDELNRSEAYCFSVYCIARMPKLIAVARAALVVRNSLGDGDNGPPEWIASEFEKLDNALKELVK